MRLKLFLDEIILNCNLFLLLLSVYNKVLQINQLEMLQNRITNSLFHCFYRTLFTVSTEHFTSVFHLSACCAYGSLHCPPVGRRNSRSIKKQCKTRGLPFIRSGQSHLAGHSERRKDKADRGRGGKTTSGNGQAWSSPRPRGQWRTRKSGGNWL